MCGECEVDGSVLPSLESFGRRSTLPKVCYLFYDNFFKGVVGEGAWNRCFAESRMGTSTQEALSLVILRNNYFAWLYEYKLKYRGSKLRTEYDEVVQTAEEEDSAGSNDGNDRVFSGDLDTLEIALPDDDADDGEFKLLLAGVASMEDEYKEAKEAAEKVRKETVADMREHDQILSYYSKESSLLASDDGSSPSSEGQAAARVEKKRKQKVMDALKLYTGDAAKRGKRDPEVKGIPMRSRVGQRQQTSKRKRMMET